MASIQDSPLRPSTCCRRKKNNPGQRRDGAPINSTLHFPMSFRTCGAISWLTDRAADNRTPALKPVVLA
ncbi:hypothetical protein M378DRAFT_154694 [Amanita muscaria Koide BX008]|uniref:Uncharacterized protein n=1 Tax=Amanita muscaria (strain Koide BX008) TaxID=946122 RepID=A0A0C2XNN5_AMAMK|nr:hypothetical protein M378DRAFT_154694 [Amanita muscaria Koide BX008]